MTLLDHDNPRAVSTSWRICAVALAVGLATTACKRDRDADRDTADDKRPTPTSPAGDTSGAPAGDTPARSAPAGLDLRTARIVDLTHSYDDNTIFWPTSPSTFKLETLAKGVTEGGFYYAANAFCTPEHGGTHLDAPVHFYEGAHTNDQIPVADLVGPAVVIDVRAQARADPDYRLTRADVTAWEALHGRIPARAIALLYTGWGDKWPDRKAYLGDDTPGDASNLHFPSFGADAAQMLITERDVAVLGLDTASIDHGPTTDFPVHQIAGKANVPGLENLAQLGQLPATGAWVAALPIKIAGGSGGPARVIAFLPDAAP